MVIASLGRAEASWEPLSMIESWRTCADKHGHCVLMGATSMSYLNGEALYIFVFIPID